MSTTSVVTRKSASNLEEDEANRFVAAVETMMRNINGPGTSEFIRLARIHGMDQKPDGDIYCDHRNENFPGWHRIYMYEFEQSLREADITNGNDGNIGLPYWDWGTNAQLPDVAKRLVTYPSNFLGPREQAYRTNFDSRISDNGPLRDSDSRISGQLQLRDVSGNVEEAYLNSTQHFDFASTSGDGMSLETPHDTVHVSVGDTLSSIPWAPFDIVFWLHHSNCDRLYEAYLQFEPDSMDEYRTWQWGEGWGNRSDPPFNRALSPFRKNDGTSYTPRDCFHPQHADDDIERSHTTHLLYEYDELPKHPSAPLMFKPPTVAMFENVNILSFGNMSYNIYVYIVDKNKRKTFNGPQTFDDIGKDIENKRDELAGSVAYFGRGTDCSNCRTRPPQDFIVNITKTLDKLKLSRYDVDAIPYFYSTMANEGKLITFNQFINTEAAKKYKFAEITISGPTFETGTINDSLSEKDKNKNKKEEVQNLQIYLKQFGIYDGKIDGVYGANTKKAVELLQKSGNLKVDGITGSKTKEFILGSRRCANGDKYDLNGKVNKNYLEKKTVFYWIGVVPGYLKRAKVLEVINKAFNEWQSKCGLEFKLLPFKQKDFADIQLFWSLESLRARTKQTAIINKDDEKEEKNEMVIGNDVLRFDNAGGILAHGGDGYVVFDTAERWEYGLNENEKEEKKQDDKDKDKEKQKLYNGVPIISLYAVSLHEIGHSLGLQHSVQYEDVMSPYYKPEQTVLSKNDIDRISKAYPN